MTARSASRRSAARVASGNREQPQNHRQRQHDADGLRLEALGREPHRQERHVHAQRDESAGVEQRHPPHEAAPCGFLGILGIGSLHLSGDHAANDRVEVGGNRTVGPAASPVSEKSRLVRAGGGPLSRPCTLDSQVMSGQCPTEPLALSTRPPAAVGGNGLRRHLRGGDGDRARALVPRRIRQAQPQQRHHAGAGRDRAHGGGGGRAIARNRRASRPIRKSASSSSKWRARSRRRAPRSPSAGPRPSQRPAAEPAGDGDAGYRGRRRTAAADRLDDARLRHRAPRLRPDRAGRATRSCRPTRCAISATSGRTGSPRRCTISSIASIGCSTVTCGGGQSARQTPQPADGIPHCRGERRRSRRPRR